MIQHPKKMAVLSALQHYARPISLPELLLQLGSDFAERSVRRWLNELVSENQVEKTGQMRATKYRAISRKKRFSILLPAEKDFVFSDSINSSLKNIKKPLLQRNPISYNADWIEQYQPNHTFYLTDKQRQTLQAVGKPALHVMPAATYTRKIYNRLLIELSYNSSRLEGNTYTLGETEKLVMEGIGSVGKLNAEKVMILNHKEAIRYLVENAARLEINFDIICTLHYLLSEGLVSSQYAGKIRDHSVRIGQSTYIPLEDIVRLSKQLTRICSIANQINNPHEQSLFLLIHIAYLQPFTDVNKRTSRLSANIPLIKNHLYPISFSKMSKDDYISAMLSIYENNDPSALAELYTFSSLFTAKEYNALLESMDFNDVLMRFRTELRGLLREIIVRQLNGSPMQSYIKKEIAEKIPDEFREACEQWINDELKYMGPERIVGLGITKEELLAWRKLQ